MPKIVITHAVKDVETWLKGKAERVRCSRPSPGNVDRPRRRRMAATTWPSPPTSRDMDAAQKMMTTPSPEAAATAERHGVIQPVITHIENSPSGLRRLGPRRGPVQEAPLSTCLGGKGFLAPQVCIEQVWP